MRFSRPLFLESRPHSPLLGGVSGAAWRVPRPALGLRAILIACTTISTLALIIIAAHPSSAREQLRTHASFAAEWMNIRDPCASWNPYGMPADDPPRCERAKQFREIQKFHLTPEYEKLNGQQRKHINTLMRCAHGSIKCPKRPLILIDYSYAGRADTQAGGGPGEDVWIRPIINAMRRLGYVVLVKGAARKDEWDRSWAITRYLSGNIHMYWTVDGAATKCLTDPHCVAAADYALPANNGSYAIPVHDESKRGKLPSWRVFGVGYWGARPHNYPGHGQNICGDWGICGQDGEEEWSHHVLGAKWEIVPFEYPKHTAIPLTIEEACSGVQEVPYEQRSDAVLILAKMSYYFGQRSSPRRQAWPLLMDHFKDVTFLCTAGNTTNDPMPSGISIFDHRLGPEEWSRYMSTSKALLGVGKPEISPSPYEALCAGTPVVMPFLGTGVLGGWKTFQTWSFQHGPVVSLGEPYAYSYNSSDPQDLIDKLEKAMKTPIKPFIPPEMKLAAVKARVKEVLEYDWEGEYERIKRENGGKVPPYDERIVHKCFEAERNAWCTPGHKSP